MISAPSRLLAFIPPGATRAGLRALRGGIVLAGLALALPSIRAADVLLRPLDDQKSGRAADVSFGVPWAPGTVQRDASFQLNAQGKPLPLQSWPLAYWPDGSVKWTGFATVTPAGLTGPLTLSPGSGPTTGSLKVTNDGRAIVVDTGALACTIPTSGTDLITSLRIGGKEITRAAQLVCILQNGADINSEDAPAAREKFLGNVQQVTVEQSGPVRAVVKLEGMHRGTTSGREWLPFTVRLYFYTGETAVRVVHTIVFDGDQEKDFVRGLGLQVSVPLREEARNRTVRFAGAAGGLWSEPLQPGGGNAAQEAGTAFTGNETFGQNAVWDDFKLVQPNPDGFSIVKRTNPRSTWLFSAAGQRAPGFAYVGDLGGGLGVSLKNFWQSFPASLEVRHASAPAADLIAWLWSPDGPAMDMRHYDTHGHGLSAAYEDVQPGLSTPYGVARTTELTLYPGAALPSRAETVAMADDGDRRPLLACSPEYIHSTGVFGVWSLPDRSTPFKKTIEEGLDSVLAYYQRQVDERSWYGFWQFGDVMHSYSAPRHNWHYDWGGHAWDNTELGTPLWIWYSYLRSGRADLFRFAEAYTRNTSETNVYHLGEMKGLGSRHNVIKWGDGAKEARISQAAHWRFFYYLTTDERTGDIMHEMALSSDLAATRFDPMREAAPPVPGEPVMKARIRIGPDWFALAGNWMTEWERTGDNRWRDRILAGVDSILAMPYWLETGQPNGGGASMAGFDIETGKLSVIRDPVTKTPMVASNNLATIQGGAEVMFELVPLLGRKDFETAWLQFCRIGAATADILTKDRTTGTEGADASLVFSGQRTPRLAAYAYAKTKNPAFAQKAVSSLLGQGAGVANPRTISGPDSLRPVSEDARVSTNEAAQTGLSTIEVLELCKDQLPTTEPVRPARGARGAAPAANRPAANAPAPKE